MRKQYKRVLASAMAAILIWNTCGWQVPALAASVVYQVRRSSSFRRKFYIRKYRMEQSIKIWSFRTN